MSMNHGTSRRAFTMLEMIAAVIVMSIIAAVITPVISSASEHYTTTRQIRTQTEQMAFAVDRMARMLRQAPIGSGGSGVGISSATASSITFSDGTGFLLDSGRIEMLVPGQSNALLCPDIDTMIIEYLASNGVTSTLATPELTHRVAVTLTSGDLRMSILIFPRVWIGQEGT